jgi:hypothetical protein
MPLADTLTVLVLAFCAMQITNSNNLIYANQGAMENTAGIN